MSRLPFSLRRGLGVACLVLPLTGCVEEPPPPPPVAVSQPAQPAWEEQVQQVRSGASTAIRRSSTPITPAQWAMLRQECNPLTLLEADFRLLTADDLHVLASLPELSQLKLTGPVDDAALLQISAVSPLTVLNLPDGLFSNTSLQSLSALTHLELLRFGSPHVTDDGLAVLAQLPALRFLHLIDVPVTDAGLKHLRGLTQLESLYLDGDRCTDEGLYELLQALPELHFHRDQLHLPDDPQAHPHAEATE